MPDAALNVGLLL